MPRSYERSKQLFAASKSRIPGGVNSPVRAFRAVGGEPVFIAEAKGCRMRDVDGNEYIDYMGTWGPAILGHAEASVIAAVTEAAQGGLSFGAPTAAELELAELIATMVPSIDLVRLVSSGTEACMSAVRLARAFTGRDRIIKFDGCYHGHADSLLAKAGSGVATLGLPDSPGVPATWVRDTVVLPFGDLAAVDAALEAHGEAIAGIIVEPVAGNMGCIDPGREFLEGLRTRCSASGAALIFDEVMTGFRVRAGGVQAWHEVTPDITCLGKIVGGGMPLAAYGGRAEIMQSVAPAGPMYQAGTLSGNPLAVAAGLATLKKLQALGAEGYAGLEARTQRLSEGLAAVLDEAGFASSENHVCGMATVFFNEQKVANFDGAKASDTARFGRFHRAMLEEGVYLPPSQFEAYFPSFEHGDEEIEATIAAARRAVTHLD